MSNALRFLDAMGGDPAIGRMAPPDYASAVASLEVDAALQQALLARDRDALNRLLGGREKMMCLIWQPEREPERREDQEEPQAPEKETPPDKE